MNAKMKSEFWARHLSAFESSFHFVLLDDLEYQPLETACSELSFSEFFLDAQRVVSMPGLMDGFAKSLELPGYFGRNWDALLDLMTDLSWNPAKGYVLVFANAEPLPAVMKSEFRVLIRVIEATIRSWRDERGEYGERTCPIPFQVLFCGGEELRTALLQYLKEPLCDHQTQSIFRTPGGLNEIGSFTEAKRLLEAGAEPELILTLLRERGVGRIDSVYALAGLMKRPVPEARDLVNASQTWSHRYDTDARFRAVARDALRHLGFICETGDMQ